MKAVFLSAISMSLRGAAAGLLVLLARVIFRNAPKKYVYLLWFTALFALLCPFKVEVIISYAQKGEIRQTSELVSYIFPESQKTPAVITHASADGQPSPEPEYAEESRTENASGLRVNIGDAIAAVWLAGVCAMLSFGVCSYLSLCRKMSTAFRVSGRIYESHFASNAFILGYVRPKIIIPAVQDKQLTDLVLLHEKTHLRRGDNLVKLLWFTALCVHWFNPAVWLCYSRMTKDMEQSCDDAVLARLCRTGHSIDKAKHSYGHALINAAERSRNPVLVSFGGSNIRERVNNIMKFDKKIKIRYAALFTALFIALSVFAACEPVYSGGTVDGVMLKMVSPSKAVSSAREQFESFEGKSNFNYDHASLLVPEGDRLYELTFDAKPEKYSPLRASERERFGELMEYWTGIAAPEKNKLHYISYSGLITQEAFENNPDNVDTMYYKNGCTSLSYSGNFLSFNNGTFMRTSGDYLWMADDDGYYVYPITSRASSDIYSVESGYDISGVSYTLLDGSTVSIADAITFSEEKLNNSPLCRDDCFEYLVYEVQVLKVDDRCAYCLVLAPSYKGVPIDHEYYMYNNTFDGSMTPTPFYIFLVMSEKDKIDCGQFFLDLDGLKQMDEIKKIIDLDTAMKLMENYFKKNYRFDVLTVALEYEKFGLYSTRSELSSDDAAPVIDDYICRPYYRFEVKKPEAEKSITVIIDAQTGQLDRLVRNIW